MGGGRCFLVVVFVIAGFPAGGSEQKSLSDEAILSRLVGDWCLDRESFGGDVSHDGAIWRFEDNGRYFTSIDSPASWAYSLDNGHIRLENYGVMEVLSIDSTHLVTRIHSTYHFLKNECSPETHAAQRLTAFNALVLGGELEQARRMLADGVDVNGPDKRSTQESTPLMMAVKSGSSEMVAFILGLEPDLSRVNAMGQTALDVAERHGTEEIRGMLRNAYKK